MKPGQTGSLWQCPACGREFANRNQTHSCGRHSLDALFARTEPHVRVLFDRVREAVERIGPVRVLAEKTRIAFQVRMSFPQVTPRRTRLDGHVVLARRRESPRVHRVEIISLRNVVHHFRITAPGDVDDELNSLLREAYAVGEQRHLRPSR